MVSPTGALRFPVTMASLSLWRNTLRLCLIICKLASSVLLRDEPGHIRIVPFTLWSLTDSPTAEMSEKSVAKS